MTVSYATKYDQNYKLVNVAGYQKTLLPIQLAALINKKNKTSGQKTSTKGRIAEAGENVM